MKNLLFILGFLLLAACSKKVQINGSLRSAFGYRQGSYWIYKDSATGNIDSAYVQAAYTDYSGKGCVKSMWGSNNYETMTISIRVSGSDTAYEDRWMLNLTENKLYGSFSSRHANKFFPLSQVLLLTYPVLPGRIEQTSGCYVTTDSGTVQNVLPTATVNGKDYSHVIPSQHAARLSSGTLSYSHVFYLCPQTGLVKIVFTYPGDSMSRVLSLVRYNIVK